MKFTATAAPGRRRGAEPRAAAPTHGEAAPPRSPVRPARRHAGPRALPRAWPAARPGAAAGAPPAPRPPWLRGGRGAAALRMRRRCPSDGGAGAQRVIGAPLPAAGKEPRAGLSPHRCSGRLM